MENYTLKNGIKIIYDKRYGDITSFCIGFNAGALDEKNIFNFGTAHALEHMVSKGTIHKTENEINTACDNIFGFENAMTNFPYTIYYGSCLKEDLDAAISLYSDILINPLFPGKGFKEEINIICEELKEWKGDLYQHCEDILFRNSFSKRRIKEIIIGSEKSIRSITLDEIKNFYKAFYRPDNCVISFSSSLDFEFICDLVERYFSAWEKGSTTPKKNRDSIHEKNINGIYRENLEGIEGAKIQYIFDISNLSEKEFKAFLLFNEAFGQGTSSFLFNEIRTKNAAAYEIGSHIKNETGIKLLSINMGTSKDKVDKSIYTINELIHKIKNNKEYFTAENILKLSKRIKIKRKLKLERSIQLCKEITTYELMYGDFKKLYNEIDDLDNISGDFIYSVINKVLKNPSIQITGTFDT